MNASLCKYEKEVTTALRFGQLSDELQAHVAGCAACSEVMLVGGWLQHDADSIGEISIPDAALVWRRALSRSRAANIARAIRPIQWVIHASIAVMIAVTFWLIPGLPAWFGWLAQVTASVESAGGMWVAISVMAGAATIVTALFGAVYILRAGRLRGTLVKT